jgi:hypothetical protein
MIIVFSKDRAFQLEACLRTLFAQCSDAADVPIRILWTASNSEHRQSYAILCEAFRKFARLQFIEESSFRFDLIIILGNLPRGSWRERMVRLLQKGEASWSRSLVQAGINLLLRPEPAVLFAVDDTLFLRSFHFAQCSRHLLVKDDCVAFSLRLGLGLTRFYMGDRDQKVPELTPVDKDSQVYQFRWTEADGDFAYPLEISSSLLKLNLILSRLLRKKWHSPNTLELALANMAGRYRRKHPMLLTFREPRAVAAPLNMVQQDFTGNRFGGKECHRPEALCRLFLEGGRADLSGLNQMHHTSVHMEIDLLPAFQQQRKPLNSSSSNNGPSNNI